MQNNTIQDRQLISTTQLVGKLSISRPTIWRMKKKGQLPLSFKIQNKNFWLLSEIEDWIDQKINLSGMSEDK